jgi:hypothetical protein
MCPRAREDKESNNFFFGFNVLKMSRITLKGAMFRVADSGVDVTAVYHNVIYKGKS